MTTNCDYQYNTACIYSTRLKYIFLHRCVYVYDCMIIVNCDDFVCALNEQVYSPENREAMLPH